MLDLLSTLREGAMPVQALIGAGALFGISGNAARVELARLVARGLVDRDGRGQYRLAAGARAVQEHVASWRRLEDRVVAWPGTWTGVLTGHLPRTDRAAVRRRARALDLMGFRELEAGFSVRPDNLRGGTEEIRRRLHGLGLERSATVFTVAELDAAADARARGLWDALALQRAYRETQRRLEASEQRLQRLSPDHAMAETFLLGGEAIRQLVYDPLLPEPIVPAAGRHALVEATRHYDRVGRACWRRFMRMHGAPHRQSPVDLRLIDGDPAGTLPAAVGGPP